MIRVIVVDDEKNILEETALTLKQWSGVQVAGAFTSPVEAMIFANQVDFDVAILDIEMPGMNGINLAELIKAVKPNVQIVFVTGYDQYALQAYGLHAIDYLMKPFSQDELRASLERVGLVVQGIKKRSSIASVEVRTFGKFDVYVDGKALSFSYNKGKELFAFLVDARGGEVSMEQVINRLWEDRPFDSRVKQLYRKAVSVMRVAFKENNCENVCFYKRSRLAVNTHAISCDLYRFLDNDEESRKAYVSNYMPEYSWAEETNAMLDSLSSM